MTIMESRCRFLFVLLMLLAGASAAVLTLEPGVGGGRQPATAAFQRQVGGLGFEPALDLSGCAFGFDPRLEGWCTANVGALPGGACFCDRHGGLLACSPLRPGDAPTAEGDSRALPP
jgi:hypothetical protein